MDTQNAGNMDPRGFPGSAALGGAVALGAVALGAGSNGRVAFAQGSPIPTLPLNNEMDVLNFALALEHFEATLYDVIVKSSKLQGMVLQYVRLFGQQEQAHVAAITQTIQKLGGTPIPKGEYVLPDLTDTQMILGLLETVEQVGTRAYQGAAPLLKNNDTLLTAAGSIMQVEARHTALIRHLMDKPPVPDPVTQPLSPEEVLNIVAPFFKK